MRRYESKGCTHSIHEMRLPIDPAGLVSRQERNYRGDLLDRRDALRGMEVLEELDHLLVLAVAEEIGVRGTWRNGVHSDSTGTQVLGENTRELFHGSLGGRIHDIIWRYP